MAKPKVESTCLFIVLVVGGLGLIWLIGTAFTIQGYFERAQQQQMEQCPITAENAALVCETPPECAEGQVLEKVDGRCACAATCTGVTF